MSQSVETTSSPTFEQPAHSSVVETRELDNGMFVHLIDGDKTHPTVEAYTSAAESTRHFYVDDNVYGVTNEDGQLFKDNADDQPDYAKRSAIGVRNYIGRQSTKDTQTPLLARAKDGFAYRDSPDSSVGILLRKADGTTRRLYQDPDDATKVSKISTYTPEAGDQLLMGNRQLLDFAADHSQDYDAVLDAMREKNASFMNIVCEDEYVAGVAVAVTQNQRRDNFRSMRVREEATASKARQAVSDTSDTTAGDTESTSPLDTTYPAAAYDSPIGPAMEDGSMVLVAEKPKEDHKKKNKNKDKKKKSKQTTPEPAAQSPDTTAAVPETAEAALARVTANVERHDERVEHYSKLAREVVVKRSKGRLFETDGFVLRGAMKAEDVARSALAKFTKGYLNKPDEGFFQKKNRAMHEDDDILQKLDRFTVAFDNSYKQRLALDPLNDEAAVQTKLAMYQQMRAVRREEQRRADTPDSRGTRLMTKYANLPTRYKVALGLGVGAVTIAAGAGIATLGGTAAVVGGAGLVVAKGIKSYGQTRSNLLKDKAVAVPTVNRKEKRTLSAREQIIAARDYTQHERKKASNNKKIATGLAAVALIPFVGGIAHKIMGVGNVVAAASEHVPSGGHNPADILNHQGGGSGHNPIDKLGSGDVYHAPSGAAHVADVLTATHNEFMSSAANAIPVGGGGEAFALAHNMSPSVWYNNQAEFLAKFPGEAFQMPDGNVGFTKAGSLSKAAVEFWATKAGR